MVPSSADIIIHSHQIRQSETGTRNIGDVVKTYPLQEVLFRGDQCHFFGET